MRFKKLQFTNAAGLRLSAMLDLPVDGTPTAYALFAHCFTCSKNTKAVSHISRALAREGIAVLRFDFTGLGESEGDFTDTNFSSNVDDLVMAAEFMAKTYEAPKILIGHSLGGAAVLQAAAKIPSALAVITIAAPADPGHLSRALGDTKDIIERQGEAHVNLAGRTFKIKKQFLDDLESVRMHETLRNLNKALLIFHSPIDDVVGIENAAKIFQAARHPKSFISLDSADHLLLNPKDSQYVASVIATWAAKYVETGGRYEEQHKSSNIRGVQSADRSDLSNEARSTYQKDLPVIPPDRSDDLHHLEIADQADLVLFMAGNQFMAMEELVAEFRSAYPGVKKIFYETLPPGLELKQILAGGAIFGPKRLDVYPDIYTAVDKKAMLTLQQADHIKKGDYHLYLHNRLSLMVAAGNPAQIASVEDLQRDDVRISQPDPANEDIAHHIIDMYRQAGGDQLIHRIMEEKRATGTTIFTVVHHRETPLRIAKKTVDVGPVWATEIAYAASRGLAFNVVEPGENLDQRDRVNYYICRLAAAPHPENARAFLDFIRSSTAQTIYQKYGFVPHLA